MSSRNARSSPEDRRIAPVIYRALENARARITNGERDAEQVKQAALDVLRGQKVEYLEVVDACTLQPVSRIEGDVRIATAVWIGGIRLIDNVG